MLLTSPHFSLEEFPTATLLRLKSADGTNRLTRACVISLTEAIENFPRTRPLIITGNSKFFSAGADLAEIAELTGPAAFAFAKMGQALMKVIEQFPAPTYAAIEGYCMGGGVDLALACRHRIASQDAIFGHRGAALGLITGWGGTQRLTRLIGKGRALEMLIAAEKVNADSALGVGLVDTTVSDPIPEASRRISASRRL
jgi:enoyl-CoA hydratase